MDDLNAMYEDAVRDFDRRLVLRQYYMDAMPEIIKTSRKSPSSSIDVYPFDWKFNKNERRLWTSIRTHRVAFYPEFPVFDRFIDFGNPYFRIGLEADSKAFHTRENDLKRDQILRKAGWTIFHVPYETSMKVTLDLGEIREKMVEDPDFDETADLKNLLFTTSCGIVSAIEYFYFMSDASRSSRDKRIPSFRKLAEATLHEHCYLELDLDNCSSSD